MSRNEVPQRVYRLLFAGIVCYFGLFAIGQVTNLPLLLLAAEIVFGVIALGLGATLYSQADGELSAIFVAAIALLVGCIAQFGFLMTGLIALSQVSSLAVFAGIGLYIYAVWFDDGSGR